MIVELSATPPRGANVLVDVRGHELNAEEMIKLDLHIWNRASTSWQDTLLASIEHRGRLEEEARVHEAETGVYIRPICLIQVERTGQGPAASGRGARGRRPGLPGTASRDPRGARRDQDEPAGRAEGSGRSRRPALPRVPDPLHRHQAGVAGRLGLLVRLRPRDPDEPRLEERADASSSAASSASPARRRPACPGWTRATSSASSDAAPTCSRRSRKGFGLEGLQGLEGKVVTDDPEGPCDPPEPVVLGQRERYRKAAHDLVLPAFMIRDGREWRLVHYEADVLSRVPWDEVDVRPLFDLPLGAGNGRDTALRAGLDEDRRPPARSLGDSAARNRGAPRLLLHASRLRRRIPRPRPTRRPRPRHRLRLPEKTRSTTTSRPATCWT